MTGEYKDYMNDRIKKEKAIISEYPFLRIRDIDGSIDVKSKYLLIPLEIPTGWHKLFFQFCDDLKEVLIEEGFLDTFYFIQIKEKYNRLECYSGHFETDKISQVLRKYEYLSQFVCTRCGKPATKEITQGYIVSLCDSCLKKQTKHYATRDIKFDTLFKISTFGRSTGTVTTVINVSDEWNRYLKRIEVIE